MSTALLIALLLSRGVCQETNFQGPGGLTVSVVVCPPL